MGVYWVTTILKYRDQWINLFIHDEIHGPCRYRPIVIMKGWMDDLNAIFNEGVIKHGKML